MESQLLNQKGEKIGKVELPEAVFGLRPSPQFLHEVVTASEANRRAGTAHTKTRAEVSGGGRKPWKQKHTGRARHGSTRSPLWRKGGVVFGPRTRSYRQELPQAKRRLALAQALSARAQDGSLRVVDSLALDGAKTKQVAQMLKALKAEKRTLLVADQHDQNLIRASRNIAEVKILLVAHLNALEVLGCRNLILTKAALEKLGAKAN
ncbi:MAG TPA: 50S ribosomal protein L4 [Elusimicrobia bacterium]|nr:50S ribosomal protein L4 [Elusimicrobiota bacterium]